jgi:hypothetical protein
MVQYTAAKQICVYIVMNVLRWPFPSKEAKPLNPSQRLVFAVATNPTVVEEISTPYDPSAGRGSPATS